MAIKLEKIFAIADGLVQTVNLDIDAPHNFVSCTPCDANGDPVTPAAGTVVYEIKTYSNPYWTDIEANNDWLSPVDSAFQAPATELRVTISGQDAGITHFRVAAVQYYNGSL